jgi:hypothetical protein
MLPSASDLVIVSLPLPDEQDLLRKIKAAGRQLNVIVTGTASSAAAAFCRPVHNTSSSTSADDRGRGIRNDT